MNNLLAPIVMTYNDRELFVYRIISGVVTILMKGATLKVFPPTTEVYLEACEKYYEVLHNSYTNGIKDEEELTHILIEKDLWSWHDEKYLKSLPKKMDDCRLSAYENRLNKMMVNKCKNNLMMLDNEYTTLTRKKNKYMHTTCESIASTEKIYHIVKYSCFDGDKLCDFEKYNIESVIAEYNSFHNISEKLIRYLSRNQPWSTIWSTKKKTGQYFFSHPNLEMTNNQKTILAFSQMYDSVYESIEKPTKEVIEDDVLLDGWFISQIKDRERRDNQNDLDKTIKSDKIKNSSEVYSVVGNDKERAERIESMNNINMRMIKKERESTIKGAKGPVSQAAFQDEKIKLGNQSHAKFKGKFGNGK